MELYKLKDQVQESVDYANANQDGEVLLVTEPTKNTLICPINQSIPEKYFKTLDCETATTKRRAYFIGVNSGDICINYTGPRRSKIRDFVLDYVEKTTDIKDIRGALRDTDGNKGLVYAPIPNGIEFAIYGPNQFYCNNEKLTDASNIKKANANISIDGLVEALEKEFETKAISSLPENAKLEHIENMRGVLKSCGDGRQVFNVKKKMKFRLRCPMVFDEIQNANVPKVCLLGFGGLNNTDIEDGFYEGDLIISYQEDELEETIKFLEDKGDVEWLDGRQ